MSKFTENEYLPNFEFRFKFLENLRKPLTLKSTRKHREEKKQNGRDEGLRKPNDSSCREKPNKHREKNQTGINAEGQASIHFEKPISHSSLRDSCDIGFSREI